MPRQTLLQGRQRFRQRMDVADILRRYSGAVYLPLPGYCSTDSAGTTPATKDSVVGHIRDLIGTNHATQATAGYKPILRQGAKNLLLNSATLSTQNVTTVAIAYTLHFTGTGTITLSGTSTAGPLVGTGATDRVSLTFTPTAGTLTLTVSGSVTSAMLEIGSVVHAYVATTSSPASNGVGLWWLDFDGTDDRLTSGTFSWSATSGAICAAYMMLGGSQYGIAFTKGGTSQHNATDIGVFCGNESGTPKTPNAIIGNGSTNRADTASITKAYGVPFVQTAKVVGRNVECRINGYSNGAATATFDPVNTASGLNIGGAASGGFCLSAWYGGFFVNGTITDAELLFLERRVGQYSGVVI